MKKLVLGGLLGLSLLIGGVGLAYLSLEGIEFLKGPVFLGISTLLIIGGTVILFWSGRQDIFKPNFKEVTPGKVMPESVLEKNTALVEEWNKTNQTKDKLKLLKMSAEAQEKA